jgi:hypothetical protein
VAKRKGSRAIGVQKSELGERPPGCREAIASNHRAGDGSAVDVLWVWTAYWQYAFGNRLSELVELAKYLHFASVPHPWPMKHSGTGGLSLDDREFAHELLPRFPRLAPVDAPNQEAYGRPSHCPVIGVYGRK